MVIKTIYEENLQSEGSYQIPALPLSRDLDTVAILKATKDASRALGELKGSVKKMPNEDILINTLSLQEAKDSSAIENIITTNDELYTSDVNANQFSSAPAKEVYNYVAALKYGYRTVTERDIISNRVIKDIQAMLEENDAGFRSQSGTALKNEQTDEIVYLPPQNLALIESHMKNLEEYINNSELSDVDPLVKMAVIHHQFESIHPFFDGNGRTGRIINIVYLVKEGLLDSPILYLSRYINHNKEDYYRLLQHVRDSGEWEEWILFILEGVRQTSYQTIELINDISKLMLELKHQIRVNLKNVYSQDLINNLFCHPYTKIDLLQADIDSHRNTARNYLESLVSHGILDKQKIGNVNYYINKKLYKLLLDVGTKKIQTS